MDQATPPPEGRRIPRRALYAYAVGTGVCGITLLGAGIYAHYFAGTRHLTLAATSISPLLGRPAPAFSLPGADRGTVGLAQAGGKMLLLNFWATWCVPCRQELPALQRFARQHQTTWSVIGIDELEGRDAVAAYARSLGVTYPVAVDSDGSTGQRYGVQGLPTSFVVDRQGIVRQAHLGELDAATLQRWSGGDAA